MRILVVEDEPLIALWTQAILEDAGHMVIGLAQSQAEAMALAERDRPDLVLMDINLADGHGVGIELARRIRQQFGACSLFLSGQSDEARTNRDAALGYLAKPWEASALLASIMAVQQIMAGQMPRRLPPGLELFRRKLN